MCRKIAMAKLTGNPEIEIWGDGEQTRSFCYIDDCLEGLYRLMRSDFGEPLNLGQDRMVTINQLADIIADIAGIPVQQETYRGAHGRARAEFGQHAAAQGVGMGAGDFSRRGAGEDISLD